MGAIRNTGDRNAPLGALRLLTADGRRRRWLTVAVVAWALAVAGGVTLRLNFDRAPVVHVRWTAAVDDRTRAALEERFGLAAGEYDSGRTWVYILTSPSAANIEALVRNPAVEDTHHIDRLNFRAVGSASRGPYITEGPRWIPPGLQVLSAVLALTGLVAFGIVAAPVARPALVRVFAPEGSPGIDGPSRTAAYALVAMFGALALVWGGYLTQLREGAIDAAGFRVGDWLVSYEVGFVRRGLLGSPIVSASDLLAVRPERVVLWLQAALYALLFLLLFVLARPRRLNVWFLAFLFSPAGLLFPLYDEAVIGRKDVLFFVAFALYAWWMPRPGRVWAGAAAFALGAAMTLAHEMFFFFTPYFFVMRLLQSKEGAGRPFAPELSLFAGSLLALLFVSTVGADIRGDAQCAALLRRGFDEDLCAGIMRYPVTTVADSIRETAAMVREQRYLVVYPIAAGLAALPLLPLLRSIRHRLPPPAMAGSLAALVFSLPMFVIALDWGRLLNIHVTAIAVVIVAFLMDDRKTAGSVFGGPTTAWLRIAWLLGLALYLTGWSVRHCCTSPLTAGVFQ